MLNTSPEAQLKLRQKYPLVRVLFEHPPDCNYIPGWVIDIKHRRFWTDKLMLDEAEFKEAYLAHPMVIQLQNLMDLKSELNRNE